MAKLEREGRTGRRGRIRMRGIKKNYRRKVGLERYSRRRPKKGKDRQETFLTKNNRRQVESLV